MPKILQVVIYKSISDQEKLREYTELAGPAMKKAGAKFLARGLPISVKEAGEATRTVVIEWENLATAEAAYNSEEYQAAIAKLGGSAIREFRYIQASY